MYRAFIAGGIAACGAVTVTHSFETVKIRYASLDCIAPCRLVLGIDFFFFFFFFLARLQLQGELQSRSDAARQYRGVFHAIKVITQREGLRGLFRGLNCAVCEGMSL